MLIVKFDMQETNFVVVANETYFLLVSETGHRMLVKGQCSHRGGPLHLACLDKAGQNLICPWHETRFGLKRLIATAMPMICIDEQATALLPVQPEAEAQLMRRRIRLPPVPIGETSGQNATEGTRKKPQFMPVSLNLRGHQMSDSYD
jgi:nitrite reductase/ring-hydroxylating ferredoxin subunit